MKTKGFTLVELLVVIAIISMLMGILMPALSKAKMIAQLAVCGANLSGAGKALLLYANEYNGQYVQAGGRESRWGPTKNWKATTLQGETAAFGPIGSNTATIGANFYYLIKYADASPKLFICKGDNGAREFKLSEPEYRDKVFNNDITEAWDFGSIPQKHYSYAYQVPFNSPNGTGHFPLSSFSDPEMAIMADRNPYIALTVDLDWDKNYYVWRNSLAGSKETEKWGNSPNHRGEGQNVLFNDIHVEFARVPYCGVNEDNIYSAAEPSRPVQVGIEPWPGAKQAGLILPTAGCEKVAPRSKTDSVLINDGTEQGGIRTSGHP